MWRNRRLYPGWKLAGAVTVLTVFLFPMRTQGTTPYMEILQSGSLEQRIEAMLHLGYAGNKKAFWLMVKNLDAEDAAGRGSQRMEHLRSAAAEALGRLHDERAVSFLVERYQKEKSLRVKESIIFSLGLLKNRKGFPVIENGLTSGETGLVIQSIRAAAMTSNADFIPKIKEVVQKTDNERIGLAGTYALLMMGDDVQGNMKKLGEGLISRDPVMRFWSASYITETGMMEGLEPLLRAREIESIDWVRREIDAGIHRLALVKKRYNEEAALGHLKNIKIETPSEAKDKTKVPAEKNSVDKK